MAKAMSAYKLGKQPARRDPRTLQMANYVQPDRLPPVPPQADYGKAVPATGWPMMLNDRIGDCTCAAVGHMVEEWTANADGGKPVVLPDASIVQAYSAVSGYDPATGANDNGANELDVLNYWRKTGVGGRKIVAYVALEPGNHLHIQDAVYLFGGCYIGLALPVSAQTQRVWSVPPGGAVGHGAPGSWGGHAVNIVAYDARGLTCVTWGATKRMTWQFWDTYCDEAYAILSTDWLEQDGRAPVGFDLPALQADLQQVVGASTGTSAERIGLGAPGDIPHRTAGAARATSRTARRIPVGAQPRTRVKA